MVLEIDVPGARAIERQMPESVLVFIAPPDIADLETRLAARGTNSSEDIEQRLRIARAELGAVDEFRHVIVNDDIECAAEGLIRLIHTALNEETR